MKKLKFRLVSNWKRVSMFVGMAVFALALLSINIVGLTNGKASGSEQAFHTTSMSLSRIIENPLNFPLSLTQWLASQISATSLLIARLPSVLFAVLALAATVYVLRKWYGPRTAFFGFFLFSTSAWLLHVGRLATPDILLVWAIPVLLTANLLLHDRAEKTPVVFGWLAVQVTLLYIPGMVWFVLLNLWFQRHDIQEAYLRLVAWWKRLLLVLWGLVFAVPLAAGLLFGQAKSVGLGLLGLPQSVPAITELVRNALDTLLFIGVRGNAPAELWLNHLPLLNAFLLVGFGTGLYFYGKHWRAGRAKMLGVYILLGLLLCSLGGPVTIGILLPLLYLIAAAGIAYLLHLWLGKFPKNPLARAAGITLLAVAIGVTGMFGIRQYYVAWPHHPGTSTKFQKHI